MVFHEQLYNYLPLPFTFQPIGIWGLEMHCYGNQQRENALYLQTHFSSRSKLAFVPLNPQQKYMLVGLESGPKKSGSNYSPLAQGYTTIPVSEASEGCGL